MHISYSNMQENYLTIEPSGFTISMVMKMKKDVDMLNGPLVLKILVYAIPLIASGLLQQLFNAADSAVVGSFAGANALAAVGANTSLCTIFVNGFVGLSVGTNVVVAQYIGAQNTKKIPAVVQSVILFAIIGGICVTGLGEVLAENILGLMGTPVNIIASAAVYLRIYLLGIPFMALFNFGSAIVRSNGDTKLPMIALIIAGILNVALNLLLVIVFKLSVAGVAIATVTSNMVSSVIIIVTLCKYDNFLHLDIKHLKMSKEPMLLVLKCGAPAALQSMVFSLANISIQSGINSFGSDVVAGSAATQTFEYMDYQVVNGLNQAAVTFVGQNYAARKYDRVKKIFAICMVEALIGILLTEAVFWFGRYQWLSFFVSDEVVMGYAIERMITNVLPHFLLCSYEITGSVLRGMGHSLEPALLTVLGSVGFRVLWLVTIFKYWLHSLQGLLLVYPASWILTGVMVITCYIIVSRKEFKEA